MLGKKITTRFKTFRHFRTLTINNDLDISKLTSQMIQYYETTNPI